MNYLANTANKKKKGQRQHLQIELSPVAVCERERKKVLKRAAGGARVGQMVGLIFDKRKEGKLESESDARRWCQKRVPVTRGGDSIHLFHGQRSKI